MRRARSRATWIRITRAKGSTLSCRNARRAGRSRRAGASARPERLRLDDAPPAALLLEPQERSAAAEPPAFDAQVDKRLVRRIVVGDRREGDHGARSAVL